jgi:hypothetical protein
MQKIAQTDLEKFPTTCCKSDLGVGRKSFFAMPVRMKARNSSDFIYVYVESRLSNLPKDAAIGYTTDDLIESSGIHVFKKVGNRVHGETFDLDALLSEITDPSLRDRLIYRVNDMQACIRLDEEFIERANTEHESRTEYFH